MAIVLIHKNITREVLDEFGFSRKACEVAAEANAAIDQKQGSSPEEANLHAMRGRISQDEVQSREEAINKVSALCIGVFGAQRAHGGRNEIGGYMMLTWGATPGTLSSTPSNPAPGLPSELIQNQLCSEASQGPTSYLNAKANSREFVKSIKNGFDTRWWNEFVKNAPQNMARRSNDEAPA